LSIEQPAARGGLIIVQANAALSLEDGLAQAAHSGLSVVPRAEHRPRLQVLDGWRGISILCVLCAHLQPLGPTRFGLNESFAALGMVLFFTLSGFLITTTLLERPNVNSFLIRRVCRIVPLAWLYSLVVLTLVHAPWKVFTATLLFYANLPPFWHVPLTMHLWSLCLEMQFYLLVAVLFGLFARRGLYLLPVLALLVTLLRVDTGKYISIVPYERADEILAGATLALTYAALQGRSLPRYLRFLPALLLPLTFIACHPAGAWMNYLRPYLGAALIGSTLFLSGTIWCAPLRMRWLVYVAEISFSLYVIHVVIMTGWFDPASKLLKYARRPIGLALVFLLAHCSTRFYESRWIALGKRLTRSRIAVSGNKSDWRGKQNNDPTFNGATAD
jgi:peptidoglycan/LPS O-acetylase OafA/YrhL